MNKPQVVLTPLTEIISSNQSNSGLAEILMDLELCDQHVVTQIQDLQIERGMSFIQAARALGALSEEDLRHALTLKFGLVRSTGNADQASDELIAAIDPTHPYVNTLRLVRDELSLNWFTRERRVLALAGVEPGAGCSHIAANLATVFAQQGSQVLLIDADLGHSRQSEIFSISTTEGLMDCLAGWSRFDETVARVSQVPGLSVLSVGTTPSQTFEILNRKEFSQFVTRCAEFYDVVLIDTPTGNQNADILAAAKCAGGAALVLRKNHTRFALVQTLQSQLDKTGSSLVGTILTDF
jgi:protein-tyrosine kinase